MPYEFLEHTADIRMRVSGRSPEELYAAAVAGMVELMAPAREDAAPRTRRSTAVTAPDSTALLIEFLNAVLLSAQVQREAYDRVTFAELSEQSLRAELEGTPVRCFGEDIKAVTHHEAQLRRTAAGTWETVVVFDI
jgi:SHS2 domain-containing protein